MSKNTILIIVVVVMFVGGLIFKLTSKDGSIKIDRAPQKVAITIVSPKNQWKFIPDKITVKQYDEVTLTLVNEDEYDHGIAIDLLGINTRMPRTSTSTVSFTATKTGTFNFYCSVACGEGMVDGKKRTHYDMLGSLIIEP